MQTSGCTSCCFSGKPRSIREIIIFSCGSEAIAVCSLEIASDENCSMAICSTSNGS